jgi:hypothetical protein
MLQQWVDNDRTVKGEIPKRWEANEMQYRNQPDEENGLQVSDESPIWHLNLTQPRVDSLVSKVCNPMTARRPYFTAMGYAKDKERLQVCQDSVHFCLEKARFPKKFRDATRIACMAAPCYYRVWFDASAKNFLAMESQLDDVGPFGFVGPTIDVIHPNDMVIYPVGLGLKRAVFVGRRFLMRQKEIHEFQKVGRFMDDVTEFPEAFEQEWESGRMQSWSLTTEEVATANYMNIKETEQNVAIYEGIAKLDLNGDGHEERYIVTFCYDDPCLLDIQPYEYSRIEYFEHYLKPGGYGETYHANPPAQDLQALQNAFNDLWNILLEGSKISALPPVLVEGGVEGKMVKYKAGCVINVPAQVNYTVLNNGFNPQEMPVLMAMLERIADSALRVSQPSLGQKTSGDTTATEVAAMQGGQEEGSNEYRDNAAESGEAMADFIRELCYRHYDLMVEAYGEAFPCKQQDREKLREPLRWEQTGKTAQSIWAYIAGSIEKLLEFTRMPVSDPKTGKMHPGPITDDKGQPVVLNGMALMKAWIMGMDLPVPLEELFPQMKVLGGGNGPGGVGTQPNAQEQGMGLVNGAMGQGAAGGAGSGGELGPVQGGWEGSPLAGASQ